MPTRHPGSWAKNSSTLLRDNFCRRTMCPAASTPCTRKTDFAISNPIVVTCFIVALLPTHPQIMLREGRESRPHHQKQTVSALRPVAYSSRPQALPRKLDLADILASEAREEFPSRR